MLQGVRHTRNGQELRRAGEHIKKKIKKNRGEEKGDLEKRAGKEMRQQGYTIFYSTKNKNIVYKSRKHLKFK